MSVAQAQQPPQQQQQQVQPHGSQAYSQPTTPAEISSGGSAPVVFHPGLLSTTSLLHTNVSKLAQDSLNEVKRLRILLTRLLVSVTPETDDSSDEGSDKLGEESTTGKIQSISGQKGGSFGSSPFIASSDVKPSSDGHGTGSITGTSKARPPLESLSLHKLVTQISETFETLDQLANRMHNSRLNSRVGELGLHSALSLFTTVDQLEFTEQRLGEQSTGEGGSVDSVGVEHRRVDWLTDRTDAERWSNRYWERTHTVLEGLLACSVFRRSHLSLDHKRRRPDFLTVSSRDPRIDLEHLLNELHCTHSSLTITLIESGSNLNVVHVKVGEVMQCFVNFRRLHPEKIIVRGVTECMILKSTLSSTGSVGGQSPESDVETLSKPLEELIQSKMDPNQNVSVKETIFSLLAPEQKKIRSSLEVRSRRSGASGYLQRPVLTSTLGINNLDLVTPSQHSLFRKITALAQCALLHFSNDYQPPSAVRGLFAWLNSYEDLFTAPCSRCGQLLGQDVNLPYWRSYRQLRKDDPRSMKPQHEHCQAIA